MMFTSNKHKLKAVWSTAEDESCTECLALTTKWHNSAAAGVGVHGTWALVNGFFDVMDVAVEFGFVRQPFY